MQSKKRKLFCEISPTTYAISQKKEVLKRHVRNLLSKEQIASKKQDVPLANTVSGHSSRLIKTGKGIDPVLQENKAVNIELACERVNGLVIHPGETFSFWQTIGKTSRRKGYREGRVIEQDRIVSGIGGGLCNLGNTIHLLILHSPLQVTEFHSHSDALAPDHGKRIPFSSGTSVCYNYIDYKFYNQTDQNVQLMLWCSEGMLHGELRSEHPFPYDYRLLEEDHHFRKEGDSYFRVSKIYRCTLDKATGELIGKELVLDNHSRVMFDESQIPQDQIRPFPDH